jgi:hypothetical protein
VAGRTRRLRTRGVGTTLHAVRVEPEASRGRHESHERVSVLMNDPPVVVLASQHVRHAPSSGHDLACRRGGRDRLIARRCRPCRRPYRKRALRGRRTDRPGTGRRRSRGEARPRTNPDFGRRTRPGLRRPRSAPRAALHRIDTPSGFIGDEIALGRRPAPDIAEGLRRPLLVAPYH